MTVILLRHGRSTSNVAHTLPGAAQGSSWTRRGSPRPAAWWIV